MLKTVEELICSSLPAPASPEEGSATPETTPDNMGWRAGVISSLGIYVHKDGNGQSTEKIGSNPPRELTHRVLR